MARLVRKEEEEKCSTMNCTRTTTRLRRLRRRRRSCCSSLLALSKPKTTLSILSLLLLVLFCSCCCSAWTLTTPTRQRLTTTTTTKTAKHRWTVAVSAAAAASVNEQDMINSSSPVSSSSTTSIQSNTNNENKEEDDDDEFEYIEYETLTEAEFINSEWMIGTNWDNRVNQIDETWVRFIVDQNGNNVAIWGTANSDSSSENKKTINGKWTLDVASQFLSISKENVLWGKQIWACTLDDYYYLQGTVRGWNFLSAASVLGQFQARRLNVNDPQEAGTPPWFEQEEEEETDEKNENE